MAESNAKDGTSENLNPNEESCCGEDYQQEDCVGHQIITSENSTNRDAFNDPRKKPPKPLFYPGLYAPSGFDMLSILIRVASRPNPVVDLGRVDSNCALLLCDTFAFDTPIVYCSEAFETLTGYCKNEVLGRNCRFLQSPRGISNPANRLASPLNNRADNSQSSGPSSEVDVAKWQVAAKVAAEDRKNLSILRSRLAKNEETQITVTNYKKGGQPFVNLLTIIPVRWAPDLDQLRYAVGFQADRSICF